MKKEGFNAFNNYSYTSERQLKEVFQPLLKEAGIIFKVDVTDQRVEPGDGEDEAHFDNDAVSLL